jgi:hypothetical protein
MPVDIFKFWSVVGPSDKIHPADRDVFSRITGHQFDLSCLPACFMGPLKTAPVVLLYLSPGLTPLDLYEAKSPLGQERYMKMRRGLEPLPDQEQHEPAWEWWVSRTRCFGGDWQQLRSKIAVLNIGAYHSVKFKDYQLLAALPSSRVSIEWAQNVLFPQAVTGKRVVVCLRSSSFWGLTEGVSKGSLHAPKVTIGGHMKHDGTMRDMIIRDVRKRLGIH